MNCLGKALRDEIDKGWGGSAVMVVPSPSFFSPCKVALPFLSLFPHYPPPIRGSRHRAAVHKKLNTRKRIEIATPGDILLSPLLPRNVSPLPLFSPLFLLAQAPHRPGWRSRTTGMMKKNPPPPWRGQAVSPFSAEGAFFLLFSSLVPQHRATHQQGGERSGGERQRSPPPELVSPFFLSFFSSPVHHPHQQLSMQSKKEEKNTRPYRSPPLGTFSPPFLFPPLLRKTSRGSKICEQEEHPVLLLPFFMFLLFLPFPHEQPSCEIKKSKKRIKRYKEEEDRKTDRECLPSFLPRRTLPFPFSLPPIPAPINKSKKKGREKTCSTSPSLRRAFSFPFPSSPPFFSSL